MDGGIADSIPLARSLADGNQKNVVILTQDQGYQKNPNRLMPLARAKYRDYPQLVAAMRSRHTRYNEALALAGREKTAGRAFIIQPEMPPKVRRIEKNQDRLRELYDQGYKLAEGLHRDLMEFLGS